MVCIASRAELVEGSDCDTKLAYMKLFDGCCRKHAQVHTNLRLLEATRRPSIGQRRVQWSLVPRGP